MSASIVAIGSANTEQILVVDHFAPGSKTDCRHIEESFGGSAVNWGVRLKSAKAPEIGEVYVACPIGGDPKGTKIRSDLEQMKIKVVPGLSLPGNYETGETRKLGN